MITEFRMEVINLMQKIKADMQKFIEPIAVKEGLTTMQVLLLYSISKSFITNISSITENFHIGQANASTLCIKLEKMGYITRTREKDDERIVVLSLTQKGVDTVVRLDEKTMQFDKALSLISKEKLDQVIIGLKSLKEILEIIEENKFV